MIIKLHTKFQILTPTPHPNKVASSRSCSYSVHQTVPINLAYDGSSFLQVVLCYQLHISLQERDAPCRLSYTHTDKQTHGHTHTADTEGQAPADYLSPPLLTSATARHCGKRRPSGVSRVGLEESKRARSIMLLFSVGLRCARGCVVQMLLLGPPPMAVKVQHGKREIKELCIQCVKKNCIIVPTL